MRRLGLALIALAVLAFPAAAHAAPSISGTLRYGTSPDGSAARNKLAVDFTVGEGDSVTRLELFPKVSSGTAANPQTTAGGSCFATDQHSGVICNFSPGLPPGTSGTLTFDLPQDYPAGGGAQLTARSGGVSPDQTRSVDLGGPAEPTPGGGGGSTPPPQSGADLSVAFAETDARHETFFPPLAAALAQRGTAYQVGLHVRVHVPNAGPDPAVETRVFLDPPSLPQGSAPIYGIYWLPGAVSPCLAAQPIQQVTDRSTVRCSTLRRGLYGDFSLFYALGGTGRVAQSITAGSDTSDPRAANNTVLLDFVVTDIPDANANPFSAIPAEGVPLFRGRAKAATAVDVAIRRDRAGAGAAATCTWVRDIRSRLARRGCTEPPWLRASGTRSWRLRFARPLPRGSYTLLARARRPGLMEISFSARDRNLVKFRVR